MYVRLFTENVQAGAYHPRSDLRNNIEEWEDHNMRRSEIAVAKDLIVIRPDKDFVMDPQGDFHEETVIKAMQSLSQVNVVFNMDNVEFIDSYSAGILLKFSSAVKAKRGFFAVYNMKEGPRKTIERLRLINILNVHTDAEGCFENLAVSNAADDELAS